MIAKLMAMYISYTIRLQKSLKFQNINSAFGKLKVANYHDFSNCGRNRMVDMIISVDLK